MPICVPKALKRTHGHFPKESPCDEKPIKEENQCPLMTTMLNSAPMRERERERERERGTDRFLRYRRQKLQICNSGERRRNERVSVCLLSLGQIGLEEPMLASQLSAPSPAPSQCNQCNLLLLLCIFGGPFHSSELQTSSHSVCSALLCSVFTWDGGAAKIKGR
jgi:hypothetical protein